MPSFALLKWNLISVFADFSMGNVSTGLEMAERTSYVL